MIDRFVDKLVTIMLGVVVVAGSIFVLVVIVVAGLVLSLLLLQFVIDRFGWVLA